MTKLSPGCNTAKNRPSLSTTHACCCGTTRNALAMTITATMNNASATRDEPLHMMRSPGSFMNGLARLPSSGLAGRDDERRAAGADDVHGLRTRRRGRRDFRVPLRAAVVDARRAVVVPRENLDFLPDIEPGLRRRRRVQFAPLMRSNGSGDRKDATDEQLRGRRRPEPRGDAAQRKRHAHGKQIKRAGHEFEADEGGREYPPYPEVRHSVPPPP